MGRSSAAVVDLRKRETEGAAALHAEVVPPPERQQDPLSRKATVALVVLGVVTGLGIYGSRATSNTTAGPAAAALVRTIPVELKRFESTLRVGGTVGAVNFAVVRAPRMRGGRDRGGGGGGGGGGGSGSLTIATLAEAGSMVAAGDVVAEFESKRVVDILDTYRSMLAQTRRRSASRTASLISAAAVLEQRHKQALADADKAKLDLRSAEVRSRIQAEILELMVEQTDAGARQLTEELRLSRLADQAERRVAEIDVEREERRLDRSETDLEKMRMKTPVDGLVVIEPMFQRDGFSQAAAGDTVNPGATFLRIVDLSDMALYADVNQADAQSLVLGAPASIRLDAYPGVAFEGRVSAVGAMASAGQSSGGGGGRGGRRGSSGGSGAWVRQVSVQVEITSEDERIMPDLSASADLVLESRDSSIVIPRSALASVDGRQVVWVEDDGLFSEREVVVDRISNIEAAIASGLREGELIAEQPVTDPERLRDRQVASAR